MEGSKKLAIVAVVAAVLALGVGAAAWAMWPDVDEIPERLPEVSAEVSIADLGFDAQGPMPALRLGDLEGKTVLLMIESRESMTSGEGSRLHRAIGRWDLPEDVVVMTIGDVPKALELMKDKIEGEFLGAMRDEMRYPIYVDYGGTFADALALPKGHIGVAIIDAAGEVAFRHAGDPDEAALAEIAGLLQAKEPEPGPVAPDFALGGVDNASCTGRTCVLVFLDAKVARSDIPGLEEGGFEGDMKATFEQIKKPSVRLAQVLTAEWERDKVRGVVVGEAEGWSVESWPFVAEDDATKAARAAFEIGEEAGMVILDREGRVAFAEAGLIRFWQLGVAAEILGIDPEAFQGRRRDDKG